MKFPDMLEKALSTEFTKVMIVSLFPLLKFETKLILFREYKQLVEMILHIATMSRISLSQRRLSVDRSSIAIDLLDTY